MPSTSRPSLASVMLIAAAMVWCFLIAVILMLWCVGTHFVGNPLLHFGGWVALALTGLGHRQRLADRLAAGFQPKHPILLPATDATVEFHRPAGVYRATARMEAAPVERATDNVEVLPSPSTVAAMRRLAHKVTLAE